MGGVLVAVWPRCGPAAVAAFSCVLLFGLTSISQQLPAACPSPSPHPCSNTMHLWDLGSGPDIRPPTMPCARFEGRSVSAWAGVVGRRLQPSVLQPWHQLHSIPP